MFFAIVHLTTSWRGVFLGGSLLTLSILVQAQQFTKSDRDRVQEMLRNVSSDVRKYYYDPNLQRVDWEALVRKAKENIDRASSVNGAISEIAAVLDSLNDSHTFFILPPRPYVHDYGFKMQIVGDHCYVIRVRPGSDAAKKGLKSGDEILSVNGQRLSRKIFWKIPYLYDILRPQPGLSLTLDDGSGQRQLEILGQFSTSSTVKYWLHDGANQRVREIERQQWRTQVQYYEQGDLLVVRIPAFNFPSPEVDSVLGKMRRHKAVIIDIRGNPGGMVDTLERLLGGMFQYDLKGLDRIGRNSTRTISIAGRHHEAYTGRLVVLVDSESASASELFARTIQIERRGFILGDRTSGSVMEAKRYRHEMSLDSGVFYGASITDSDLLMTDGHSLEHVGVEPDITIVPTRLDLAMRRDPAMARGAKLLGAQITADEAGALFPQEASTDDPFLNLQ